MREIKFRAWNKLLKKMVRLDKIKFWHELIYEIEDNTIGGKKITFSGNNDTIELSQFTGLIDRNNRMIFEGDILLSYRNTGNYIVRFDELDACFEGYGTDGEFFILEAKDFNKCEIIGNIYEHSHLLSGGQQ